jgi:hypothetical protein
MARPAERTLFLGALAAMVGGVLLSYWLLFGRGPAAGLGAPAPVPVVTTAAQVEVKRATGEAWLSRGNVRTPLVAGTVLKESDAIETSEGSSIELGAGDRYQVLLDGAARFGVKEIAAELSRFRLDEGLAEAKVKGDTGGVLVIETSADASVRTGGGRVAVAAASGRVAVGVTEGEAQLGSGGQIVAVRAGQISIAERGKAPSAPVALPRSLLLKVDWPSERETNRRRIVIRGQASPGALVSVGGERVKVGPDGQFTHILFLKEGKQTIEATARDVAGRRENVKGPPVVLDTRAPDTEFDTRNLWGKRRVGTTSDSR